MKALKAFIKAFEAPQRSVNIKFKLFFSLRPRLGGEGLINKLIIKQRKKINLAWWEQRNIAFVYMQGKCHSSVFFIWYCWFFIFTREHTSIC